MQTATRSRPGTTFQRAGDFAPSTFDATARTIDVVWTTGAAGDRFDLWNGEPFVETLEVSSRALRLDRLNKGAPVLDCHDMYQLGAVLGSVLPGSVRIQDGTGTATLRIAETPDAASVLAKIKAGHIRSVSVGYQVHEFTRFRGEDGEPDELRATDWEPIEISFVPVPADPGCTVRSDDMTRIIEGGRRSAARQAGSTPAPALINRAGVAAQGSDDRRQFVEGNESNSAGGEQRHRSERDDDAGRGHRGRPNRAAIVGEDRIRSLCDRANFSRDFERGLLEEHREQPFTEAQLLRAVNDELMGACQARGGVINSMEGARYDAEGRLIPEAGFGRTGDGMADAMQDALYARLSGRRPTDQAAQFMGASMADMARGLMERRGERTRWMSANSIMQRFGGHTTSDFPNLLQAATGRYLLDLYNAAPSPLKPLAARRTVPDFRQINALSMIAAGVLRPVPESGEFKRVTILEGVNGYKLATYGEIFALTRQAFVNDDLGYFADLVRMWVRAANETEAAQLAGLITANGPSLQNPDGSIAPLYDASRGNLAAVGSGINVASLTDARLAMRSQKNPDGKSPANVVPRYLVVGPAKETEAEQALAALSAVTQPNQVNPFSGKLELVVEPRITGKSWRLFADPANWPVLEYAQLQGQEGLFTDTRIGFDVDGFDFKARLDFGAGAVDWRGTYKNPGDN